MDKVGITGRMKPTGDDGKVINTSRSYVVTALGYRHIVEMKSYKAIPVDDGTCKALLVVVDAEGKERALIRYRSMTEALADRDYLDQRAKEEQSV